MFPVPAFAHARAMRKRDDNKSNCLGALLQKTLSQAKPQNLSLTIVMAIAPTPAPTPAENIIIELL